MAPIAWHVTLRLEDGRNLVPGLRERRTLAHTVLAVGEDRGLFVFGAPDTHVHLATSACREVAGRLAHATECALRHALCTTVAFQEARLRPIVDQPHLHNTVLYILDNGRRHGNLSDPCCEGTNLPDLLGLRVTGRYTATRLAALLPRLRREDLLDLLPVSDLLPGRNPGHLAQATAACVALPTLDIRGRRQRDASIAAAHVASRLGLRARTIALQLRLSPRTVRRYLQEEPRLELVRAIRLQLGLLESIGKVLPDLDRLPARLLSTWPVTEPALGTERSRAGGRGIAP